MLRHMKIIKTAFTDHDWRKKIMFKNKETVFLSLLVILLIQLRLVEVKAKASERVFTSRITNKSSLINQLKSIADVAEMLDFIQVFSFKISQ